VFCCFAGKNGASCPVQVFVVCEGCRRPQVRQGLRSIPQKVRGVVWLKMAWWTNFTLLCVGPERWRFQSGWTSWRPHKPRNWLRTMRTGSTSVVRPSLVTRTSGPPSVPTPSPKCSEVRSSTANRMHETDINFYSQGGSVMARPHPTFAEARDPSLARPSKLWSRWSSWRKCRTVLVEGWHHREDATWTELPLSLRNLRRPRPPRKCFSAKPWFVWNKKYLPTYQLRRELPLFNNLQLLGKVAECGWDNFLSRFFTLAMHFWVNSHQFSIGNGTYDISRS